MEKKKTTSKKTTKKKTTTKRVNKKKKIKKGFTLIELLAVIIILGILMLVAVPSVTTYISNSRKEGYVTTAKTMIDGTRNLVNKGTLNMFDTSVTYYIPYDMIKMENTARSPYADFKNAYVVVTYDGDGYDYYFAATDKTRVGMYLTYFDNIEVERISTGIKEIDTNIAICGKEHIIVFDRDMNIVEEKEADDCINTKGSADGESNCNTTLTTSVGSFSNSVDQKEICIKADTSYVYNEMSANLLFGEDSYNNNPNYKTIIASYFARIDIKPTSYIKVYSDSSHTNLLGEITSADYPKYIYNLVYGNTYNRVEKEIPKSSNYYLVLSPDLQELSNNDRGFAKIMYSSTSLINYEIEGIWTNSTSAYEKIQILKASITRDRPGYTLGGFINRGNNTYNAIIKKIEIIK